MKPKVFIGSSSRGLPVAEAIQSELSYDAEVVVWSQGVFKSIHVPLEDLVEAIASFDFAIFVLLPEDRLQIRGDAHTAVRDNVLFELGLFLGKLGRDRSFFVAPASANKHELHLPSDLSGLTPATYNAQTRICELRSRRPWEMPK